MRNVNNNSRAEVIVNDDVKFKAHMSVLGTRTEMIPENLRSYFSKKNTAVIAIFTLDKGQTLPLWSLASGRPVSIRIKNYNLPEEEKRKDRPDYHWYTTGRGISSDRGEAAAERPAPVARKDSFRKAPAKKDSVKTSKRKD